MSELILGSLPILVMWALPLAPMFYGAIAAFLEALGSGRSAETSPTTNAGTAVLRARAALRQQAASSAGEQQAA